MLNALSILFPMFSPEVSNDAAMFFALPMIDSISPADTLLAPLKIFHSSTVEHCGFSSQLKNESTSAIIPRISPTIPAA